MEPEMKNVGNILYRAHPLCRVCRGDRYIFIINNILKIKYREMDVWGTVLGLKTLRDSKLNFQLAVPQRIVTKINIYLNFTAISIAIFVRLFLFDMS